MNAKNYGDDSQSAIGKLNDKILYQRVITGLTLKPSEKINHRISYAGFTCFRLVVKEQSSIRISLKFVSRVPKHLII